MICEVLGCTNRTINRKKGISFHRFPYDEALKQKWIDALTRDGWSPNPLGKVCSVHFKPTEVLKNPPVKAVLIRTAVPSILPPLKCETPFQSINAIPLVTSDVEKSQATTGNVLSSPIERLNNNLKKATNEISRSKFSVISELANDMNSIKSKISQHLRTRRAKNCRLRTKIEKLKRYLIEIREETASNNPVLETLFESALEEPHYADVNELSISRNLSSKPMQNENSHPAEQFDNTSEERTENSFASYLTNELKKLQPEEYALMKRDIENILEANKPVDNNATK